MTPDVVLNFPGGTMRPLTRYDINSAYIDGLNDEEVNRFLEVRFTRQTQESVEEFVSSEAASPSNILWGIWQTGEAEHVGTVRIHGIDGRHGTAHIGVCIFHKEVWGKGIGRDAIRAATKWAIQTFSLRWVEAGAYEANLASQRAFISAGYKWVFDIPGKYVLEGNPTTVKVYAMQSQNW